MESHFIHPLIPYNTNIFYSKYLPYNHQRKSLPCSSPSHKKIKNKRKEKGVTIGKTNEKKTNKQKKAKKTKKPLLK